MTNVSYREGIVALLHDMPVPLTLRIRGSFVLHTCILGVLIRILQVSIHMVDFLDNISKSTGIHP